MNTFLPGSILELSTDANAIPAGRYRLLGEEDGFLIFAVGRKILFGLSASHWGRFLARRGESDGALTSRMEFLDRYFWLLQALPDEGHDTHKLTFCAVDPSALSEAA